MVLPLITSGLFGTLWGCQKVPYPVLSEAEALDLYARPLAAPTKPRSVFHLGHSLVGRDMPAMLAQLAGSGHVFHSQLGWGTSLKNHWNKEINGFAVENDHSASRLAPEAIDGGEYDAVVFTEMVEIRDAIRYHQSAEYLHRWAQRARAGNPDVTLYLYETWPAVDDAEGWLTRVERDLSRHWENDILLPAVQATGAPIFVVPGGQALAATIRAIITQGEVDGVSRIEDFFALAADGSQDTIHINDLGSYVIAVTHYAVLYHANPTGLPYQLWRADGSPTAAPGPKLAKLIQETVWEIVTSYDKTGIAV